MLVLVVDVLKGAAAVEFAHTCYSWRSTSQWVSQSTAIDLQPLAPWAVCLAGIAALLGHSRSIWLNFSGGKSAAAGLGVLLAMSWPVGLGAAAAFCVGILVSRIVSIGSMLAAVTAMILVVGLDEPAPYKLLVMVGGIFVITLHRANILRRLAGTEPRIGQQGRS